MSLLRRGQDSNCLPYILETRRFRVPLQEIIRERLSQLPAEAMPDTALTRLLAYWLDRRD